jgi:apolipoprotein N-acyltransferase
MFYESNQNITNTVITTVVLGGLQALALSALIDGQMSGILQIISLALFLKLRQTKNTFLMSWLFCTTWLIGSVWWLYIALHVHGHLPSIMSILAIMLLCGALSIYYGFAIYIYVKHRNKCNIWEKSLLIAACWTMAEMARAQWFTGFPWAAIGYAHVDTNISILSPWAGVYGVGFTAVFMAGYLSEIKNNQSHFWKLIAALMLFVLIMPLKREDQKEIKNLTVSLLQGNIAQDIKFNAGREDALNWYKSQMQLSDSEVTVLPETALPYLKKDLPANYWNETENRLSEADQIAFIGMITENNGGFSNSAVAMGQNIEPKTYNKYHLVPFGEFTPVAFKWFTKMLSLGMTDFERGSDQPAAMTWKEHRFALNICYEDVFVEELAKRFVLSEDKVPTVLVNISNIDWFGDTFVINQHLNIARMRSLEFNRPTIRATNSGGTAIINAQGTIESQLKPFTRDVLSGQVASYQTNITPFAYWAGHWGLKPLWVLCMLIVALFSLINKRKDEEIKNVK